MKRRALVGATLLAPVADAPRAAPAAGNGVAPGDVTGRGAVFPDVTPRALVFPPDHGAHPDYRIEWWYLTGWLAATHTAATIGFQLTFFRLRTAIDPAHPSAFAAKQLIVAHAAIADPARGALLHDQRIARAGFGVADAARRDTDVRVDRWFLRREDVAAATAGPAGSRYRGHVATRDVDLRLIATATQPLLLQGDAGVSPKGQRAETASYYYSLPHLAVEAELRFVNDAAARRWQGSAWLDHEWSSRLLDPDAAGWDWIGMNLDDGSALTAFQIRPRAGGAPLYSYASLRAPGAARPRVYGASAVAFEALRRWTSPRTRATYPVAQRIVIGDRVVETRPMFDDQELDASGTTRTVYWEGASVLLENGVPIGRGYLEMTGYAAPFGL